MKKKSTVIIGCILGTILIGSGIAYTAYNKAGDYLLQQTIGNQIENTFIDKMGIDLSESGRILTEEEQAKVDTILQAAKKVADVSKAETKTATEKEEITPSKIEPMTTDQVKEELKEQVTQVIKQVPTKDKNTMMNMALSNLSMSDISYLAGLATDGMSGKDLAEAKDIALQSFSQEELEKLKAYYDEYSYLIP